MILDSTVRGNTADVNGAGISVPTGSTLTATQYVSGWYNVIYLDGQAIIRCINNLK